MEGGEGKGEGEGRGPKPDFLATPLTGTSEHLNPLSQMTLIILTI